MRRLRNLILVLIVVGVLSLVGTISYHQVATDSGFDTGYDSGGSDWGSSGSSWDSSSSSSGGGGQLSLGGFVLFFLVLTIIIAISVSKEKNNQIKNSKPQIYSFDDTEIRKYIPNFDVHQFLIDRYGDFVNIQVSWMNFDYDNLRKKLTDELYNQYYMQLASLEAQNRKNIMSNFQMTRARILSFNCVDDLTTIKMELGVAFFDYITENDKVVRGSSTQKVNMMYNLTFTCRVSKSSASECPHCGAELTTAASQTCPYCKCVISSVSSDWVLSKKEAKFQR